MFREQEVRLNVDLIHDVMDSLGMSGYELAKGSGISKGQISKYLNRRLKNGDGAKIGTAAAIARTLGLTLGAMILPADDGWHRLDPEDDAQYFRLLDLVSKSGCLLTASESADSHILPDAVCEDIEWARLNQPQFSVARRQQLFERKRRTMAFRKKAREEGTHLTQVVAPAYVWGKRLQGAEAEFETMKETVRGFRDLTAVGFVSDETWQEIRDSITELIHFDGWTKINVGGHLLLAVWYHAEVFYTTEKTVVSQVRAVLEAAGRGVGLPQFRARGAKVDSTELRNCYRNAIRTIDGAFTAEP